MAYPSLVVHETENEYRAHFGRVYCVAPVRTFDGIMVRFRRRDFDHCFFETVCAKDDTFSHQRAERIDWIKVALQDRHSERYVGWNSKRKCHDYNRRVTIVMGDYVVVIAITGPSKADFVTAFVADTRTRRGRPSTIDMIRSGPKWA